MSKGIALLFFLGHLAVDGVGGQPHAPATPSPKKDPVPILQEVG